MKYSTIFSLLSTLMFIDWESSVLSVERIVESQVLFDHHNHVPFVEVFIFKLLIPIQFSFENI